VSVSGIAISGTDAATTREYHDQHAADITMRALTVSATGLNRRTTDTTQRDPVHNRVGGRQSDQQLHQREFCHKKKERRSAKSVTVRHHISGTDSANYTVNTTASTTPTSPRGR